MALATVEEVSGLWAVDVALLDSRDRELPFYATTSFEMKAGGTCTVQTPDVTHLGGVSPGRDTSACALMNGGLLSALGESTERWDRLLFARMRK